MPRDKWDDPTYFRDPIDIILGTPRPKRKRITTDKKVIASAEPPAVPKEVPLEDDDDFWFAQPEEPIETPVAARCAKPVKVDRLFELPPEELSTNPDVAHLARCPFCSAQYQAEKQRRETS